MTTIRAIYDGRNYHCTLCSDNEPATFMGRFSSLKKIRNYCDEIKKLGEYKKDYIIMYVR